MTIEEMKRRRVELEWNLYTLIKEFENECGVGVQHVSLLHSTNIEDNFNKVALVRVEVTI